MHHRIVGADFRDVYHIGEVIGDGQFSTVHVATHKVTRQQVAVKVVDKTCLTPAQVHRVHVEVQVLQSLDHPGIIKFLDSFETPTTVYLIMELMRGGELFDRIVQKKCFTEAEAVPVLRQLLRALAYVHQKGVIHRDVKPENILFATTEATSVIKLADFGFSKKIDANTVLTTPCGTLTYAAPEIAREEAYQKSVDLWAIGVIAYTMLCGFPPFYSASEDKLRHLVREGRVRFPSKYWKHVTRAAKHFVSHLLAKEPGRRMTAEQALQHPWLRSMHKSSSGGFTNSEARGTAMTDAPSASTTMRTAATTTTGITSIASATTTTTTSAVTGVSAFNASTSLPTLRHSSTTTSGTSSTSSTSSSTGLTTRTGQRRPRQQVEELAPSSASPQSRRVYDTYLSGGNAASNMEMSGGAAATSRSASATTPLPTNASTLEGTRERSASHTSPTTDAKMRHLGGSSSSSSSGGGDGDGGDASRLQSKPSVAASQSMNHDAPSCSDDVQMRPAPAKRRSGSLSYRQGSDGSSAGSSRNSSSDDGDDDRSVGASPPSRSMAQCALSMDGVMEDVLDDVHGASYHGNHMCEEDDEEAVPVVEQDDHDHHGDDKPSQRLRLLSSAGIAIPTITTSRREDASPRSEPSPTSAWAWPNGAGSPSSVSGASPSTTGIGSVPCSDARGREFLLRSADATLRHALDTTYAAGPHGALSPAVEVREIASMFFGGRKEEEEPQ